MSTPTFAGRTITGLEHDGYGRPLLRLDDGTAVEFDPHPDSFDDAPSVVHLTPELIAAREEAAEAARVQRERDLQAHHEAEEQKRRHIAQMRGELDPQAFEKWRRKTYPTRTEILCDVWSGPAAREAFYGSPLTFEVGDDR